MIETYDNLPKLVKITTGKSRCVINIPAKWARELGFDKGKYALMWRVGDKGLEVKAVDNEKGYWEYVQED